ncbi:MAG: hypothetical protein V4519_03085 [Patescibacteria group bacterium]
MADVEFEEPSQQIDREFHIRSPKLFGAPETPTMIKFLLRTKLVKNEKQALIVLIICTVIFLTLSFGIYWFIAHRIENKIIDENGSILTVQEYIRNLVKRK